MSKLPLSHDRPLYAYLIRYDAQIQALPRFWPNWYIYQIILKSNETILVIFWALTTNYRAPKLIKKSVKNSVKYNYQNLAKHRIYIMNPHKVSLRVKFEGSNWK